jgi:hypothetical protein
MLKFSKQNSFTEFFLFLKENKEFDEIWEYFIAEMKSPN